MKRIVGLDILRSFAIILVLFRHSDLNTTYLYKFGWLGVDLFFVISGYLVSGLLYSEYLQFGDVRLKRFAVRRGLKIYPSFLIFLMVSLFYDWFVRDVSYTFNQIFAEIFYVQNYVLGIFSHSWSLAVEEHFYILLIFCVVFCLEIQKR